MKKIYISGPISNTSDYRQRFQKVQEKLEKEGYQAINPSAIEEVIGKGLDYIEYMKVALYLLEQSDAIYMLEGWQKSRGATCEYLFAKRLNIPVLNEEEIGKRGKDGNKENQ